MKYNPNILTLNQVAIVNLLKSTNGLSAPEIAERMKKPIVDTRNIITQLICKQRLEGKKEWRKGEAYTLNRYYLVNERPYTIRGRREYVTEESKAKVYIIYQKFLEKQLHGTIFAHENPEGEIL